jgi:hypothetical protein
VFGHLFRTPFPIFVFLCISTTDEFCSPPSIKDISHSLAPQIHHSRFPNS